jgi:CheY-like chemotaxis protein
MLEELGFRVLTAASGKAGVRIASTNRLDLVVTDYEMPEMNGGEVAAAIKTLNPRIPVLLFSGSTLVPRHMKQLVDACCDKAAPRSQLLGAIRRLLQRKHRLEPATVLLTQAPDHRQRTVA